MAFKILPFVRLLTVEPLTFLSMFAFTFKMIPQNQMVQDKLCMQRYNLSFEYCQGLPEMKEADDTLGMKSTILSDMAQFTLHVSMLITIPIIIISILIGPFIDKYKPAKKILMIVASLNGLLEHSALVVNSYFFSLDYRLLYVPSIINALCGGVLVSLTAMWSYLSNVTPPHMRSMRMTVTEIFLFSGPLIGTPLAGNLLPLSSPFAHEMRNSTTLFLICCACSILMVLISIFLVDEDKDAALFQVHFPSDENKNNIEMAKKKYDEAKGKHPLGILFNLRNALDMFSTFTKPRRHNIRLHIFLIVASSMTLLLAYMGPGVFLFPYVQKVFNWNSANYSNYMTIGSMINIISTALLMPLLVKVFKLADLTFSLMSFHCFLAQNILRVSSKAIWTFWSALPFYTLNSMGMVGTRSYLTKIVEPNELGQVFALMSALDGILPLLGSLIFTPLFSLTIDSHPNLSFLPVCIFLVIGITCLLIVISQSKKTLASVELERKARGDDEKPSKLEDMP